MSAFATFGKIAGVVAFPVVFGGCCGGGGLLFLSSGTVIAALCCFTPVLVVLFGAVGLAAVVGYLDAVLFPALGIFILLTIYALSRRQKLSAARTEGESQ